MSRIGGGGGDGGGRRDRLGRAPRRPLPADYVPPPPPVDLSGAFWRFGIGVATAFLLVQWPRGVWGFIYALAGAIAVGVLSAAGFVAVTQIRRGWHRRELVERAAINTLICGVICVAAAILAQRLLIALNLGAIPVLLAYAIFVVIATYAALVERPEV